MLKSYTDYLLSKAIYEKDESGYIVAYIPDYQGLYSQGENFEEARENLIDAIDGVLTIKIANNDENIINDIRNFLNEMDEVYA